MIVSVDKCSTFGIKKAVSKSIQFLLKLIINNTLVPRIKIGESFDFDFDMTNEAHELELSEIDLKPLHPKNKVLLYNRYVLSKLSWHSTVADLSKTWICKNLGSLVFRYIRKWLELPECGTLSNLFFPCNKFGLTLNLFNANMYSVKL